MWCGDVFRHVWDHEICWHCVGIHRIHIRDWPTIYPIISWGLVYDVTWPYSVKSKPIAPVPQVSSIKSILCYRTNKYYQYKQIFYSVLGILRDKYTPQHLVPNSDRPSRIPTYRLDFTSTVESTSNRVPLNKILCEGWGWGTKCV